MSHFFGASASASASATGGGGGGGGGGGRQPESNNINNKPHLPEEFKYFRSKMLDIINQETRHVGIYLSFFEQINIKEHLYIEFSAVEQIVKQFNATFYNKGAMILLNVNGNKYTGDINIVEMKLVLMNDENPEGIAEFITNIEVMFNTAGTQANEYIQRQEQNPHVTSKNENVECYVPIIADDSTQEIVRMSPLEYEVGTLFKFSPGGGGGVTESEFYTLDLKFNTHTYKKCVPKFLFYKSYPDPNNPSKTKLYRSCGYVFDNAGKQFQIFMFNYQSQTLPFVYLFDTTTNQYIASKIQKNNKTTGPNSYTIISYDGQKIFNMDLISTTMTGDLSSVASSLTSSAFSSVASSVAPSRSISRQTTITGTVAAARPTVFNELASRLQTLQSQWKQYDREGTEEIMQLLYPKEYIDDDDDDDDDEYEDKEDEAAIEEARRDLLKFTVDKTFSLPTFPGCSFGNFARLDNLIISPTNPHNFFGLLHQAYSDEPELVCRYFFPYGDLKNFYLNADLSEFDSEDIYTFEQKENVLSCLSQMNVMSKGSIDTFFGEYIAKQRFDLLKRQSCALMQIGNNYADENINGTSVKTSNNYSVVTMETPLQSILTIVPTSILNIISSSSKIAQPATPNVGNVLIAITNNEKQLNPPSLETMDELFKDSLFSLFRTPRENLPCLFDIFGNMCNEINAIFPYLAYTFIAGGGPFALLGTGKIADVDCMILTTSTNFNYVRQLLIEKIADIMYFINANANLYFPGPFEFYINITADGRHFYRVVFKSCKERIHFELAKIKGLHSLDLLFDYYEIKIINGAFVVIGKFEKSFAALDVVIKKFTGDTDGDIWDGVIKDLPSFADKYIHMGDGVNVYPAWNIAGMLLALSSTLDPRTVNPQMRELVGKLSNECKRPKFVLELLLQSKLTSESLTQLNDVLTELIAGGTVTASIMEANKVFEMLLDIVQTLPTNVANQLFETFIKSKLVISIKRQHPVKLLSETGFDVDVKKNDVKLIVPSLDKTKFHAINSALTDHGGFDPRVSMSNETGAPFGFGLSGVQITFKNYDSNRDSQLQKYQQQQQQQPLGGGGGNVPKSVVMDTGGGGGGGGGGGNKSKSKSKNAVLPGNAIDTGGGGGGGSRGGNIGKSSVSYPASNVSHPASNAMDTRDEGGGGDENYIFASLNTKIMGQTVSTSNSLKWFASKNKIVINKKNKIELIKDIIKNVDSDIIKSFINGTYIGGARRTRHRTNKPVKTRKHRNHGENRNTRKRHPKKTIRK